MQTFKIVLTILVALLLQMLLSNYLGFFRYVDLSLIVTVYFALQRAPMLGMFSGLVLGMGGDRVTGDILGVGGFSKALIGYIIGVTSIRFSLENPLARLAVVAAASAANTILFLGLHLMLERPVADVSTYAGLGNLPTPK